MVLSIISGSEHEIFQWSLGRIRFIRQQLPPISERDGILGTMEKGRLGEFDNHKVHLKQEKQHTLQFSTKLRD